MRKALLLSFALLLVCAAAQAQFQYAAKFICDSSENRNLVTTVINVHTPFKDAKIEKRVSVGLTGERPGKISEPVREELKAGQTMQIDCADTIKRFTLTTPLDAFVDIRSSEELDVVAVYRVLGGGVLHGLEIERVPVRKVP